MIHSWFQGGAAERSEPKRSSATDIATIPERRAVYFPNQPIAALPQQIRVCAESEQGSVYRFLRSVPGSATYPEALACSATSIKPVRNRRCPIFLAAKPV